MRKVIKYKLYFLLSNRFLTIFIPFLFILLNYTAVVNSGILSSGGSDFNAELKYQLILNNYLVMISFFGLFASIYIGSSIIGPDILSGNLSIILTSYPSRIRYYLGTYLTTLLYMLTVQTLLLLNVLILFFIFDVAFLWSEVLMCYIQILLNSTVALSITGLASIYIKGHGSALIGLIGYAFFNIYTFNQIPFINTTFSTDFTVYRNILVNFFPMTDIYAPSYTEAWIIELHKATPILPNMIVYQLLYALFFVGIGCLCFKKKDI